MQELIKKIEQWAIDREVHKKGTVEGQSIKTTGKIAELIKGISQDNTNLIKDSVGDIFVTLVIGNMLDKNIDIEEYYSEINRNPRKYLVAIGCLPQTIIDVIRNGYCKDILYYGLANLMVIADVYNLDFKDCVESAYKKMDN